MNDAGLALLHVMDDVSADAIAALSRAGNIVVLLRRLLRSTHPIFVQAEITEGVATGAIVTSSPDNQPSLFDRIWQLAWKIDGGQLPPAAVIGLDDPLEPLGAARSTVQGPVALIRPPTPSWPFRCGHCPRRSPHHSDRLPMLPPNRRMLEQRCARSP